MQNVLMRPRPGLERKSFEHGVVVPLGRAPETKDRDYRVTPDTKELFDDFQKSFKQYRTKQDGRIDELQTRLDQALIEANRPIRGTDDNPTSQKLPKMWNDFFRHGIETPEIKALSVGNNADGGFTVIPTLDNKITEIARNRSDIRKIAQVVGISTGSYETIVNNSTITTGWVGEQTARPQTTNPQLTKNTYVAHEIYAMPYATQTLLDDSAVNIEEWLAGVVNDEMSVQENQAFVNGDGVAKPRGFMIQSFVAQASWTWGSVGYIPSGFATDFVAPVPATGVSGADCLVDLTFALKAEYRANATWVMNSATAGKVRKLKDAQARFLWTDSLVAGKPNFLLGFPVAIAEDMADVGADTFPIAFGDFSRAYIIVDRIGVRILRDPFTAKPFVSFYTTKRVGGGVDNYDAYKVLKIAVT